MTLRLRRQSMPRWVFATSVAVLTIVILGAAATCEGSSQSTEPIKPILKAILHPGQPPTLVARNLGGEYGVLPSVSVFLRLESAWPGNAELMKVAIDGTLLQWVRKDDIPTQQDLASRGLGYYLVDVRPDDYDVIVVPAPSQRTGSGFAIELRNLLQAGTQTKESAPISVEVTPAASKKIIEPSDVFFDCGSDYQAIDGKHYRNCKPGASIVKRNVVLAGWLMKDPFTNCSDYCEDMHYPLMVDPLFLAKFYGPKGVTSELATGRLPGNPDSAPDLRADDVSESDGSSRGIDLNSMTLPGNFCADFDVIGFDRSTCVVGELNAWHDKDTGRSFGTWVVGRGPAPAGWVQITFSGDSNAFWPYDPRKPVRGDALNDPLKEGDYVVMKGTLWQDGAHGLSPCWDLGPTEGHNAWLELHPVDWIERRNDLKPQKAIASGMIEVCNPVPPPGSGGDPVADQSIVINSLPADVAPRPDGSTLHYDELIDGRFTDMAGVDFHTVTVVGDRLEVKVRVHRRTENGKELPGRFKAVYRLWWE
jgi:hypothetical protein